MKKKTAFLYFLCLAAAGSYAADFKKALALTLKKEGGYVNDSLDRGGETYRGVARNFHPEWEGWRIVDSVKSGLGYANTLNSSAEVVLAIDKSLAREKRLSRLVRELYRREYWDPMALDTVQSQKKADRIFNRAVRTGVFSIKHPSRAGR